MKTAPTDAQNALKRAYENPGYGDVYYKRYGLRYTEGMKSLSDLGASWLIDAIASYGRREVYQVWLLVVNEEAAATLTMQEDTNAPVLVRQEIELTDFPVGTWKFCLVGGVLFLPNED